MRTCPPMRRDWGLSRGEGSEGITPGNQKRLPAHFLSLAPAHNLYA